MAVPEDNLSVSSLEKPEKQDPGTHVRRPTHLYQRPVLYLGSLFLIVVLGCMVYLATYFTVTKKNDDPTCEMVRIISRQEWLARPAKEKGKPLRHPTQYVVISHSSTGNCSETRECSALVRNTQRFHIENNGWWDIGSSFLIGGDGLVYEGRGWNTEGAFAEGYNNRGIGITFIGTFVKDEPAEKQVRAGKKLISRGVKLGKISPVYKLMGHRQVRSTESPGSALFEIIKTWPHWVTEP